MIAYYYLIYPFQHLQERILSFLQPQIERNYVQEPESFMTTVI